MRALRIPSSNYVKITSTILLIVGIAFGSIPALVEAQKNQKPVIRHAPIKSTELPEPGTPMVLSFDLRELSGVIAKERLLVVRDGKLLDVSLKEGINPETDELGHIATIHAPLVELKYWALVTLSNGNVISSPPQTLRRSCVPNIALSTIDDPSDSTLSERLTRYVQQSRDLERDLAQYEHAIGLLESLVGQMKEGE